jgi:hypothetical protein
MNDKVRDGSLYEIGHLANRVNQSYNRYSAACFAILLLLEKIKLTSDKKHEILADVSNFMDGFPVSPESGLKKLTSTDSMR